MLRKRRRRGKGKKKRPSRWGEDSRIFLLISEVKAMRLKRKEARGGKGWKKREGGKERKVKGEKLKKKKNHDHYSR